MVNAMAASFFALRAIMIYLSGHFPGAFWHPEDACRGHDFIYLFEGRPGMNSRQQKQFNQYIYQKSRCFRL